ncbi:hypothetical protein ACFW2V_13580 [Streptomyces sp. NPDC058947]|uniref:hypothetical protein n=1 Tax=Streptomyces sp. NPDC058947 TaxID=3346675 RepID=UPI0036AB2E1E
MGDRVTSERRVGTLAVDGRVLDVVRLTWRGSPGLSFDVVDSATGDVLTMDESFDEYPTEDQVRELLAARSNKAEQ